jgi:threonine dehydrogenase-like Zn-dependent dehydrogenase
MGSSALIYNKILRLIKPEKFEWEEEPLREIKDDEILLKMKYVGICGSDISMYNQSHPYATYPRILGHEISAEIFYEGKSTGRFTSISPYRGCGKCHSCLTGNSNHCVYNQTMGVQRDGAFQEYIIIKNEGANKKILEKSNPFHSLTPKLQAIAEPFFVGLNASLKINYMPSNVVVIGAGPIGLYTALNLRQKFNSNRVTICLVDKNKYRLDLAESLGFKTSSSCLNEFKNIIEVVVEASGSIDGIKEAFRIVEPGGDVILIGHNSSATIDHSTVIKKELNVFGSRNSNIFSGNYLINYIYNITYNKEAIEKTITHEVNFSDVPEFFKQIKNKEVQFIKAIIKL